ncbi:hypothetical protein ACVSQB_23795 [Bradyrhizobium elkanii]
MKKNDPFAPDELVCSPMVHIGLKLPKVLLDRIDAAAALDDPSCANRSSKMRRYLIAGLRRECEAAR